MLNHGLAAPEISQQDGYFVVTLRGPAGDYERLKVPAGATGTITRQSKRSSTSDRRRSCSRSRRPDV